MYTYINENFLHAPSTDLNHDTIRTLIGIMLAQAQEVFIEKQIADGKKAGLMAKLASQAAFLYSQAVEGIQENVNKAVFEKVWLLLAQTKAAHMQSVAQYYQALSDSETSAHGIAIARLQAAEKSSKEASRLAISFPSSLPTSSNLASDTGSIMSGITKRQLVSVQDKLTEFIKDNDFIYHQPVPNDASLSAIQKSPAAKAISVSELYQGQDIHRIIGPDIFQKIVPMSVTESASLYDEEKAKLIRAETERAEIADSEMAASLDYLKLPGSLNVLKGGIELEMRVDEEFTTWCHELAGHTPFLEVFDALANDKTQVLDQLESSSKQLDLEESVCEKMRSKYGSEWTQQPSARLTSTLRSDIKNYRTAMMEASTSDAQLQATLRHFESDFDEMRSAGEADEADVLYQRAMIKAGASRGHHGNKSGKGSSPGPEHSLIDEDFDEGKRSVADQIAQVEDLMRKLSLIKRERGQSLKDLKEKVHNDDISQVLILNKKSVTSQEQQLFKSELEKFRPLQQRLLQANHKQSSVMKDMTNAYSDLLQDKRVRSEQNRYESFSRQKNTVLSKYRKIFQAFKDLNLGLDRAKEFYSEMKTTARSLSQNVETFVSNRKSEGGELLNRIEKLLSNTGINQADKAGERLVGMMDRMNNYTSSQSLDNPTQRRSAPLLHNLSPGQNQSGHNSIASPPPGASFSRSPPLHSPIVMNSQQQRFVHSTRVSGTAGYDPRSYASGSPPQNQHALGVSVRQQYSSHGLLQHSQQSAPTSSQSIANAYVPPPPPPGPPPHPHIGDTQQSSSSSDPWAGLSGWR